MAQSLHVPRDPRRRRSALGPADTLPITLKTGLLRQRVHGICCIHESMDTVAQHIFKDSEGIKDLPILYRQIVDKLRHIQERSWPPRPTGRQAASMEWVTRVHLGRESTSYCQCVPRILQPPHPFPSLHDTPTVSYTRTYRSSLS